MNAQDRTEAPGRLIGVGLGPGDPELLTLRAARRIREARVVAYPVLERGESLARSIARDFIAAGAIELPIVVPMTHDRAPAQRAYDRAAAAIAGHLSAGTDVVTLCEGDPLFYGSFMYLHARLGDRFPVEVVPGVSSLGAGTAAAQLPLVARNECLTVLPAPLEDSLLRRRLADADAAVLMKVGRHLGRVRGLLGEMGLLSGATYVERASMAGARVLPLAEAPDPAPYFSMILVTKGADPWL
ncbi:MAG: precorrin-2 C(20)-methyltransferase [Alphaproteobacteria bacterium]|nr:MAG: precorrin-2 C(20)-methyltransferase [Alphaproteobacteria bacterium]